MAAKTLRKRKGTPIPITFSPQEHEFIYHICDTTGISKADVIRRACRFALAKFISGEVSLIDKIFAKQ